MTCCACVRFLFRCLHWAVHKSCVFCLRLTGIAWISKSQYISQPVSRKRCGCFLSLLCRVNKKFGHFDVVICLAVLLQCINSDFSKISTCKYFFRCCNVLSAKLFALLNFPHASSRHFNFRCPFVYVWCQSLPWEDYGHSGSGTQSADLTQIFWNFYFIISGRITFVAAHAIPPIATHFFLSRSVCLSSVIFLHPAWIIWQT